MRIICLLPLLWLVSACSIQFAPYERGYTPDEIAVIADERFREHSREEAFVTGVVNAVLDRDGEALTTYLNPAVVTATIDRDLDGFYNQFPTRAPDRLDMITYQSNLSQTGNGPDTLTIRVEYVFVYSDFSPVFLTMTGQAQGADRITASNLRSQILDSANWSAPADLGTLRQTVRALGIISPLILVIAFASWVAVARRLRRRLVWLFVLLATTPSFAFNWASQEIQLLAPSLEGIDGITRFELIEWIVTGVQVSRAGDYQPWVITVGLPVGALWFLFLLVSRRIEMKPELAPTKDD